MCMSHFRCQHEDDVKSEENSPFLDQSTFPLVFSEVGCVRSPFVHQGKDLIDMLSEVMEQIL